MKTYVIGDVHGCIDALLNLLDQINEDSQGGWDEDKMVFLGDYVDRGPDSKRVLDVAMALQESLPDRVTCLRGNHEDMMLDTHAGRSYDWLSNGGFNTLKSFGVDRIEDVPPQYIDWLKSLKLFHQDEFRFYVHAGIDPWDPLEMQIAQPEVYKGTWLWVRHEFLNKQRLYDKLIVHGHTVTPYDAAAGHARCTTAPNVLPNRVNVDTAAVFGGNLTAAVFNDKQRDMVKFLTVRGYGEPR